MTLKKEPKSYEFLNQFYLDWCERSGKVSRELDFLINNVNHISITSIKEHLQITRDKLDGVNLQF